MLFIFSKKTDDRNLITISDLLKLLLSDKRQPVPMMEVHGPSVTYSLFCDIDMLFCLKSHAWPNIAKHWLVRFRPSGWPSPDIIPNIVSQGCLLVPVWSKSAYSEGNYLNGDLAFLFRKKTIGPSFKSHAIALLCVVENLVKGNTK